MNLFKTLLEFMNTRMDKRTIEPGKMKNGYYEIHLDLSDYVLGYGNDHKIFNAIEKESGVKWEFVDIRNDVLNMKTKHEFKPFELDLGLVHLVRVK